MSVNEDVDTDPFAEFLSSYELLMLDKDHLLNQESIEDDPALMYDNDPKDRIESIMEFPFHKGDTVKVQLSDNIKVCIVGNSFKTGSGLQRYKVRPLNMNEWIVVKPEDM